MLRMQLAAQRREQLAAGEQQLRPPGLSLRMTLTGSSRNASKELRRMAPLLPQAVEA